MGALIELQEEGGNLLTAVFDHEFQAIRVGWEGRFRLLFWAVIKFEGTECSESRVFILFILPRDHQSHGGPLSRLSENTSGI